MLRTLPAAITLSALLSCSASAVLVTGTFDDETWTHDPSGSLDGRHSVPATAYNFDHEKWELPVQATGWEFSGDNSKIYSGGADTGEYWSYIDLDQVTLSDTGTHWLFNIKLAGDFAWIGDKSSAEGATPLKGNYTVYFGQFNTPADANNWAINVSSGDGLGTSFSSDSVDLLTNKTDNTSEYPPYGSSFSTTGESGYKGYDLPIDNDREEARKVDDMTFEIRYRYDGATGADGSPTKAILEDLDYIYVGAAQSNPSSPTDLFANDHFSSTGEDSPEYDTIFIRNTAVTAVPEPSAFIFLGVVAGLAAMRFWFKRS